MCDTADLSRQHRIHGHFTCKYEDEHYNSDPHYSSSSAFSSGTELPLMVESYRLLNHIFPFPSILDAGYPIFNLRLANVLFDVILPSVLGSSL